MSIDGARDGLIVLSVADDRVKVDVPIVDAFNYALVHNRISPIKAIAVENFTDAEIRDLTVELTFAAPVEGGIAEPFRMVLPPIEPHLRGGIAGDRIRLTLDPKTFAALDESSTCAVTLSVTHSGGRLSDEEGIQLLARDEWSAASIPESLAAFVTPRARAIQELISDASDLLAQAAGNPAVNGYQAGSERATAIARAIYEAMRAREIRYINPPASFEDAGQKIRPAHEVLVDRWGTCLDLATTYAAGLEHAGLNPIVVVCAGHAFAGYLLHDDQLPERVLSDPATIQNYVESGLFVPVETTVLCSGDSMPFDGATGVPRQQGWWTSRLGEVSSLIDIRAAHRLVKPIPPISVEGGVRVVEVEESTPTPSPSVAKPPSARQADPTTHGGERVEATFPPRVERWRNSLLDLSFRNPLLNMRSTRGGALDLHVPHQSLGTLEDMLHDGHEISLIPHDELAEIHQRQGARTAADIDPEQLGEILRGESTLFAVCTAETYVSRLRGLSRRARTVVEETGANNLFVALGILRWADGGREARAPLFLVPATIQAKRGRPFTIRIDDGAYAQPNQCLLEKLRITNGLTIPEFQDPESDESGIDLNGALVAIRQALIEANLHFTVEESAHLGIFQFSTLQLWRDLTDNWESFVANPVVKHLIETTTDTFVDPIPAPGHDGQLEATGYCPISVDGSQLEAVEWAEAGRSFVLEGPPGTGKSQTITNLIANALAAGQKVLFVAEKQAALDVVKRRLDSVGLGALCLDLHGKGQTPDRMRAQLRQALNLRAQGNPESWSSLRSRVRGEIEALARYPEALHESGGTGLSAWTARQSLLAAGDGPTADMDRSALSKPLDTDSVYRSCRELTDSLYDLGTSLADHPWRLSQLDSIEDTSLRGAVESAVSELATAVGGLNDDALTTLIAVAETLPGFGAVLAWVEACAAVGDLAITDVPAPGSRSVRSGIEASLGTLRASAESLLRKFEPAALTGYDLDALLIEGRAADGKLLKRRARKGVLARIAPALREGEEVEPASLTPTLEALIALRDQGRGVAAEIGAIAGIHLPADWYPLAEDSEPALEQALVAVESFVAMAELEPRLATAAQAFAGAELKSELVTTAAQLKAAWETLATTLEAEPASLTIWQNQRPALAAIRDSLPAWISDAEGRGFVQLGRWIQVHALLRDLADAGLADLAGRVREGSIRPEQLEPAARKSVAVSALKERLEGPLLAGFDGVARDRSIAQFERNAAEMRAEMVAELPAELVAARSFSAGALVGKAGALSRELGRKRGGQKIRELFSNFGPVIGELTPCLMMSPHSVARFLPVGTLDIDVVVFDEASQIRVAESIGAMGRGRSTIVVGDSQQMPPSNLMAATGGDEADDATAQLGVPADMESVLSEAVESNLPRLWLSWHYRSRHEALIAFSNSHYYEGRLASFPRPPGDNAEMGVSVRRIDGSFERGGRGVNRIEAEAIVSEIERRLAAGVSPSIGVVTFNVSQRDLIMDLLEELDHDAVATAIADESEPIFVKNLENVQGDERDVILFSLAFSPDPETGKLPLNFGPLNQAGGERRLNVAVTRAREQVVLFSSFDSAHIDLSRTSAVGLAHLKSYLESAEISDRGNVMLKPAAAKDLHRAEVVEALRNRGLSVKMNVGLSDFTVDLGVAAEDEGPWLAIFLDGPGYAERTTVGDREVLPHGVLKNAMGWSSVLRIWLPDWLRNPDEVLERIVTAAHEPPEEEVTEPPATPTVEPSDGSGELDPTELGADRDLEPQASLIEMTGQPLFEPASEAPVGAREILDSVEFDSRCRGRVKAEVLKAIKAEGPMATERVARIVAKRFDLSRLNAKRIDAIVALIPSEQLRRSELGDFAWPSDVRPDDYEDFRVDPDGQRPVAAIAPEEIVNAMAHLATVGLGISREEIAREAAGLFGFSRITQGIGDHLSAVLDDSLRRGQLTEKEGVVAVPEPDGEAD